MKGIVSCVKYGSTPAENVYSIIGLEKGVARRFESSAVMREGELVEFDIASGSVEASAVGLDEKTVNGVVGRAGALAKTYADDKPYERGDMNLDAVTAKMWPKLEAAALLLLRKLALGVPVIVRFHNDADGSSGAYGLYKSLIDLARRSGIDVEGSMNWRMHRSVSYSQDDASWDRMHANGYSAVERPLLLIIDFGTSVDSNAGIELVRDKFDIIWLDHHPIEKEFKGLVLEHYVNPWQHGGDSNYTAGFLACAFAKTFSRVDTKGMEEASFIGDYSSFSEPTDEARKLSMLLDLLTSDTSVATSSRESNLTPEGIDSIINDGRRTEELLDYAKNKLDEAIASALRSVKMIKAGSAKIFVADFNDIRDDSSRYPLPGRFASKLLDKVAELNTEPCVVVLHFNKFISVRVDKRITDRVNFLEVVKEMKAAYKNVESGGGHMSAGTLKLSSDENRSEIIKYLISTLKQNIEK